MPNNDLSSNEPTQLVKTVGQLGAVGALIMITGWLVYSQTGATETNERYWAQVQRELASFERRQLRNEESIMRLREDVLGRLRLLCIQVALSAGNRPDDCLLDPSQRPPQ
jgi:type VI protein secretion system component VasK